MSVCSLELSQKLYEAFPEWSAAKDFDRYWGKPFDGETIYPYELIPLQDYCSDTSHGHEYIPAYKLDYLLEKLPVSHDNQNLELVPRKDGSWYAGYSAGEQYYEGDKVLPIHSEADTPTEAAGLLALSLKKEGLL